MQTLASVSDADGRINSETKIPRLKIKAIAPPNLAAGKTSPEALTYGLRCTRYPNCAVLILVTASRT
jgi:hypothetical protein